MSSLHSLTSNMTAVGTTFGWRLDAILISGLLWMVATTSRQVVSLRPLAVAARAAR